VTVQLINKTWDTLSVEYSAVVSRRRIDRRRHKLSRREHDNATPRTRSAHDNANNPDIMPYCPSSRYLTHCLPFSDLP